MNLSEIQVWVISPWEEKHHAYVWSEKKIISELCLLTPH